MVIKSIVIQNVKGIERMEINQDIQPNRPNILVAPNGFGKSSIATAFNSLKPSKIELKDIDMHNGNKTLPGSLSIKLSTGVDLEVDEQHNTIKNIFDVFVVNSQLKPKAVAQRMGTFVHPRASMEIETTTIYKTVPSKAVFKYALRDIKKTFGKNGKILPDISPLFSNFRAIEAIERKVDFKSLKQKKCHKEIQDLILHVNSIKGNTNTEIKKNIAVNAIDFKSNALSILVAALKSYLNLENNTLGFCAAWQYLHVREDMGNTFKRAVAYERYKSQRMYLDETLKELNPTNGRFNIVSSIQDNSLVVKWPKADLISSGQRDILVFVAKLLECEFRQTKNCILIIDEFFDYLDDANVVAFQYYITKLIDTYKKSKRIIFPILLTHLDPNYLKHFCFNSSKMNVCYLKEVNASVGKEIKKIVANRENDKVKEELDKYFFHFSPCITGINLEDQFRKLNLNIDWATPSAFIKKIDRECRKYIFEPTQKYDPLAICFSIRLQVEKNTYERLEEEDKPNFLLEHGTNNKLLYAQSKGVFVPETYFLLGIIYNHPLHTAGDEDLSKPLGMKLDNPTIKSMIMHLWT